MSTPARYWREIPQRYRYEANKCPKTGRVFFPKRLVKPGGGRDFEDVKLASTGEVVTYTVVSVAEPRFKQNVPYATAIVKLDDGAQITAMLADVAPDEVHVGMRVKVAFRKMYSDGEAHLHCYGYKYVPE